MTAPKKPRKPLHIPHRSRHVPMSKWKTRYNGPVPEQWHAIAEEKGFRIHDRVGDRYHLILECHRCGGHTLQKAFVLRTANPICGACQSAREEKAAEDCGFELLGRNDDKYLYRQYRMPCGHILTRQAGSIERLRRKGKAEGLSGFRCPTCHAQQLAAMAKERGWALIGPDPEGNSNYRLYRHGCGNLQRIAIANMMTGRFGCSGCGECWSAAPSAIYVMAFDVEDEGNFIKIGYSRDPVSRLRHQLDLAPYVKARLLHRIPIATGHLAQKTEKALHAAIAKAHPGHVVAPADFRHWINVRSEIYRPAILDCLAITKTEITLKAAGCE